MLESNLFLFKGNNMSSVTGSTDKLGSPLPASPTSGSNSPRPSTPTDNKAASKAKEVFSTPKSALAPFETPSRAWVVFRSICFPLAWLVEKIVELFQAIIKCCKELAEEDVATPDPLTSSPSSGPSSTLLGAKGTDSPDIDSDSGSDDGLDDSPEIVGKVDKFLKDLKQMETLKKRTMAKIDELKEKPHDTSLEDFFSHLDSLNDSIIYFRKIPESIDTNTKEFLEALEKEIPAEKVPEGQKSPLKERKEALQNRKAENEKIKKELADLVAGWDKFLKDNKDNITRSFRSYQKDLQSRFDSKNDKSDKADSTKKKLELYNHYVKVFGIMEKLKWVVKDDVHNKLQTERKKFVDAIGLVNIGNTCWMNATLQALYGIKEVTHRIKTMTDPAPIFKETEAFHKERTANIPPVRPRTMNEETDEEFEKRIQDFENKYPVKRSDKVEKMLHEARMAFYEKNGKKGNKPELRKAETDDAFQSRLKKHGLIDYVAGWKKIQMPEKYFEKSLDGKEEEYKKQYLEMYPHFLSPLKPESEKEFTARKEKYYMDKKIAREQSSTDELAKKKEILTALKGVWNAWENDESKLEDALKKLEKEIYNGISHEYRAADNKGEQNDSAPLVEIIMEVLGFQNIESAKRKSSKLNIESVTAAPSYIWNIPLAGQKVTTANDLIENSTVERPNTDPDQLWNTGVERTSNYLVQYSLTSDPQPVMALRFERRWQGKDKEELEDKVKKIDLNIPEWERVIKHLRDQLGREDLDADNIKKSLIRTLLPGSVNRHPINFKDYVLDLSCAYSPAVRAKYPNGIRFRARSIIKHAGTDSSGHYTSVRVEKNGAGRHLNDETVSILSKKEMSEESSGGYIVLCERIDNQVPT